MSGLLALSVSSQPTPPTNDIDRDEGYTRVMTLGHGMIYDVMWHPRRDWLAVAASTGLRLVTPELEVIAVFPMIVQALDWSPDGAWLALQDDKDLWSIYKIDGLRLTRLFPDVLITQIEWHELTGHASLYSGERAMRIVNMHTQEMLAQFSGFDQIAWSPDQTRLALRRLTDIDFYDTATWQRIHRLRGTPEGFGGMWWSPDGTMIATKRGGEMCAGDHGVLTIWDTVTFERLQTLRQSKIQHPFMFGKRPSESPCSADRSLNAWIAPGYGQVFWTVDGTRLITTTSMYGFNPNIQLWDARTGQLLKERGLPGYFLLPNLLTPDGEYLVSRMNFQSPFTGMIVLDTNTLAPVDSPCGLCTNFYVSQSNGGFWAFTTRSSGVLSLIDYDAQLRTQLDTGLSAIDDVAWNSTGDYIAISGVDELQIRSQTGTLLARDQEYFQFNPSGNLANIPSSPAEIGTVSWSPDGRYVAVESLIYEYHGFASAVHVYDLRQRRTVMILRGDTQWGSILRWLPGNNLLYAPNNWSIDVWNVPSGEPRQAPDQAFIPLMGLDESPAADHLRITVDPETAVLTVWARGYNPDVTLQKG